MTGALVLHDLGVADGGARWRAAIAARPTGEGWSAPDLPGHGSAPAPRNGAYDPMAMVTLARRHAEKTGIDEPLVIGVGANAHAALVLAAGRGCSAVVIVDGLHGPFCSPDDEVRSMYATLRAIAAEPSATAPPPEAGLDPRAAFGYGVSVSARFLQQFWGSITVPVLAVETTASPTPVGEREERLAWFGGPSTLVVVEDGSADGVLATVASWSPS